jgi:hypothetical protein
MKGVTAMNVKHSTMPQGKRLTDMQLKDQWEKFDWKLADKHINGLQTRITNATFKKDWNRNTVLKTRMRESAGKILPTNLI